MFYPLLSLLLNLGYFLMNIFEGNIFKVNPQDSIL